MKKLSMFAALLFVQGFLIAQKQSLLKPSEVSISNSISSSGNESINQSNLEDLFPNEGFLSDEMIDNLKHNNNNNFNYFHVSDYVLSLNLGFNILNKETNKYYKSPVLRLGFQYRSISPMTARSDERYEHRIDTLVSTNQNNTVYVDSVYHNSLNMAKHADIIALDASLIFRTDTSKLWSLFGGGGVSAGFSIDSYTLANIHEQEYINFSGDYSEGNDFAYHGNSSWGNIQEKRRNKVNLMGSIYFPLGIDVRLGQRSSFLRYFHLFYEARPGVNILSIPEIRTFANFTIMHGLGMRVRF